MVRPAATIVLTAIEQQKLIGWARAATTPQRFINYGCLTGPGISGTVH
jgi:hypothetical protein